jgi:energy-converting hydrogenase B subunit K
MKYKYRVSGGCVLCLMCVYECPVGAISIKEDVSTVIDEEKCIGCGSCYRNCQTGAIVREEK